KVAVEHQARLAPYLELASKMGLVLGQLAPGVQAVEVEVVGDVAEVGTKAIGGAALAGLLRPPLDVPVNEVNAQLLAVERGLRVSETMRARGENFTTSVTITVVSQKDGRTVESSVKGTV